MKRVAGIAVFLLLFVSNVFAYTEICGNGIDDDASGGDASCGGDDADNDGFNASGGTGTYETSPGVKTTATDCDDTNNRIYPGIYKFCGTAGYQLCQSNGSYSSCVESTTTPLCEATGGGTCYYVDAVGGSDSNAGTYGSRWQTISKVTTSGRAANNVIYLFNGTYTHTLDMAANNGMTIKNYPGQSSVVLDPNCSSGSPCDYVIQLKGDAQKVEGLNQTGGWSTVATEGGGIRLEGATNAEIRNNTIYDNDGDIGGGANVCGVYVYADSGGNNFHHNTLYDNYGRTSITNQNNRQIALFTGTGNHIQFNSMRYTAAPGASTENGCIVYKHSDDSSASTVYIHHNMLSNCGAKPIASGQPNSHIHHNTIGDMAAMSLPASPEQAGAIVIKDLGGPFRPTGIIIERNSIINSRWVVIDPRDADITVGPITVRYNVFHSNQASHSGENTDYGLGFYASLLKTETLAGPYASNNNCFYNTTAAANYSDFGVVYSFADWKTNTGFDLSSFEENPTLAAGTNKATSANCLDKGWNTAAATSGGSSGGSSISAIDNKKRRRCLKWSKR